MGPLAVRILKNTQHIHPSVASSLCAASQPATMPSDLETSMESMMMVFHRYADEDGDCKNLSKEELKKLMETELASFLKTQKDPKAVDKIMKDLDQNGDGKVNFEEFVALLAGLSIACETLYLKSKEATKKK